MNLTAMAGMTDPILLANWIQKAVDSTTGRHVDLVFIQILANTISSIDLASIFLNIFFIILIALLTRTAVRIVDRMLANYIPTVVSKVQMKMDETMQLMMRRLGFRHYLRYRSDAHHLSDTAATKPCHSHTHRRGYRWSGHRLCRQGLSLQLHIQHLPGCLPALPGGRFGGLSG